MRDTPVRRAAAASQANCFCSDSDNHATDCIWTVMNQAVDTIGAVFDVVVRLETRIHQLELGSMRL